jgi:hypothetical protein
MKLWDWHSVDSASWKMSAAMGNIYVPQRNGNCKYDYSLPPLVIGTSPMSPNLKKAGAQMHLKDLYGATRKRVLDYLEEVGAKLGSYKIVQVYPDYKPKKGLEFWYNRKKLQLMVTKEKGIVTHWEERSLVNARFIKEVMERKAVPVKHIYFAGAPRREIEPFLGNRLLTYHDMRVSEGSKCIQILNMHLDSIKKGEGW